MSTAKAKPLYLGLDLGGTNIKGVVATAEAQVLAGDVVPTEAQAGPAVVIRQMEELAYRLVEQTGTDWAEVEAVGVGVAAWLNHEEGLVFRAANLTGWIDIPLREEMSHSLGKPVVVENDGNSAAWGEYVAGAGRGAHSMVLLTVGTGVGGGVVINDSLLRGYTGMAGELGHIVIQPDGPECVCGNRGCLETFASATAVVQRFEETVHQGAASTLAQSVLAGEPITSRDIYEQALAGDALSLTALQDAGQFLGIGVHNLIAAFNPQRVVLAGGMIAAGELILEAVRREVAVRTLPYAARYTKICRGELGKMAGAIGAAGCAVRRQSLTSQPDRQRETQA